MAELIEMPFMMMSWLDSGNHILDGGTDLPMERGNFEAGGRACPDMPNDFLI